MSEVEDTETAMDESGMTNGDDVNAASRSPAEPGADGERFERRWSKKSTSRTAPPDLQPVADSGELEKERVRANELFERLQRSMADLSNYRKRVEAEREEMAKLSSMLLVTELLPVMDNFERALESIPSELRMFSWLQGIVLIERHLRAILERQGVEPIETVGQAFDPNLHEAIVEEESDGEPGTILGELQKGYTMYGHVIRPTLAKLAKARTRDAGQGDEAAEGAETEARPPAEGDDCDEHVETGDEDR